MFKLLGLCGYATVGKDEAWKQALNLSNQKIFRVAYADELKREVLFMLKSVGINVDFKKQEDKKFWRDMLVFWGAKMRSIDPLYWVKLANIKIEGIRKAYPDALVAITDCRYANEVQDVKAQGGYVTKIWKKGCLPNNPEEVKSFKEIKEQFPKLKIIKNDGTKEELGQKIIELFADMK